MSKQNQFEQIFDEYDDQDFKEMMAQMSDKEREEFRRESIQLLEEMEEMFEEFENRTIYDKLSAQILDNIPDDDLVLTVFDTITTQAPEHLSEEDYLATLSPERLAIYTLYLLEGEVNNGGFNQYYYNTEASAIDYLPKACETISSPEYADLISRANHCFLKENIAERFHDDSIEAFHDSYEDNPLDAFDDEFYQLDQRLPLYDLLVKLIRENVSAFTDE